LTFREECIYDLCLVSSEDKGLKPWDLMERRDDESEIIRAREVKSRIKGPLN